MFEQLSTAKKLLLPIVDIYQQQKHFSQIYFLSLDLNIVGAFHCFCIRYSFQESNVSFGNTSSSIYYCQTRQYTAEIFWQNSEYIVIKIFFPIKLMTHETLSVTTWQI